MQQTVVVAALLASAALGEDLRAAELRGRVRIDGRPAAAVSVAAVPFEPALDEARREARGTPPPQPLAVTETRADGSFTLSLASAAAPAPAKGGTTQATSPLDTLVRLVFAGTGATACRLARVLGADEDVEAGDVVLTRARTLAGRVVDGHGGPVIGATVTLSAPCSVGASPIPATATTGADGSFRFPAAGEHGNTLRIEAPGFATAQLTFVPAGTLSKPVALAAERRAEGRVLKSDARTPAGGALLRFEGRATSRWVEAGSDGRFALEGLAAEDGRVVALHADGEARAAWRPTGRAPLELLLAPGGRLSGRVLDAVTRAPLPGRRVVARGQGASLPALSGADGRYELRALPAGTYTLNADDVRYVPWQSERVPVARDAEARQDVLLVPAAALRGRVVDETGAPVAGACGRLLPPDTAGRPSRGSVGGRASDVAFCSAGDGSFSATRLAPGRRLRLSVAHDDYEPRVVSGLTLAAGDQPAQLTVVLRRGLVLRGSVLDADRKPVAEAEVVLASTPAPRQGRGASRFGFGNFREPGRRERRGTDAGGRFEFRGLTPGDYELEIAHAGYARQRIEPVKVTRQPPPEALEVVLNAGAAIRGFVRDRRGQGVEGVALNALRSGAPLGPDFTRQEITGPDGSFAIEGLVPGASYDLLMVGLTAPSTTGVTAPAEGVELRVSGQGRIRGIVTQAEDGQPVRDFMVWRSSSSGGGGHVLRYPGRTDFDVPRHADDGRFVLEDVEAGAWDVEVRATGYVPARVPGVTVEEGADTPEVEVRLTRGVTLSGRVLEATSGRPVADAAVGAVRVESGVRGGGWQRDTDVRTDADGRFRFDGLSRGSYVVTASHAEWTDASRNVALGDEGADGVELRLERGGLLAGIVTSGGHPLAGAAVALTDRTRAPHGFFDQAVEDVSDENGLFRFEHVAAGQYAVSASLNSSSSTPVEVVLAAGQSRTDLRLELVGGARVRGRVTGLSEAQLAGVQVSASGAEEWFASVRTGAGGSFELAGVPAGRLWLTASVSATLASHRSASTSMEIPEPRGEFTAEIAFPHGLRLDGHVTRAGQPVTDATVTASASASASAPGRTSASASTDASGAFALEGLQEGEYEVFVHTFSQAISAHRTVRLQADQTLEVELPTARIAGTVVDADTRQPLAEASVGAFPVEGPGMGSSSITDAEGRFVLRNLEPRAHRVTASRSTYASETRTLTAGDDAPDVEIELRRGEALPVVARDAHSSAPLPRLVVNVLDATGASAYVGSVALDSDGRGEVPSLRPGVYELRASAPGYAPLFLPGVTVPSAPLGVGLTTGAALELRCGPQTLARPAAHARLVDPAGRALLPTIFSSTPDVPLGQPVRRVVDVPPGRYALVLDTGGEPAQVELRAGATTVVSLP